MINLPKLSDSALQCWLEGTLFPESVGAKGLSLGSGLTTAFLPKVFISPFAVYSNALQESANSILYNGLIEELVDVLQITDKQLMVSTNILMCMSGSCVFCLFSFRFLPGV